MVSLKAESGAPVQAAAPPTTTQPAVDPLAGSVACVEAALKMYKGSSPAEREIMIVPLREAFMTAVNGWNKFLAWDELAAHKTTMEAGTVPWWKQRCTRFLLCSVFVVVTILSVALGVSFSSRDQSSAEVRTEFAFTSSPSMSAGPTLHPTTGRPSLNPSSSPSSSQVPSSSPSSCSQTIISAAQTQKVQRLQSTAGMQLHCSYKRQHLFLHPHGPRLLLKHLQHSTQQISPAHNCSATVSQNHLPKFAWINQNVQINLKRLGLEASM